MPRRLFVDSSGWYALIDRRDSWHVTAKEQVERLLADGGRLATSDYVVDERFAKAEAFFRKHRDQAYSFTDCTSFTVMREFRLAQALTSDSHFRAAGFEATLT